MNKIILTLLSISFILPVFGGTKKYSLNRKNENYESCINNKEYLRFKVENTKIGLFTSKISGYVKNYIVSTETIENYSTNNIGFVNTEIKFDTKDLDSDNSERDQKLKNYCLNFKKYPQISIKVSEEIKLGEKTYKGIIDLKGKKFPLNILIKLTLNPKTKKVEIKGNSLSGFKALEIPDPSIAVAKLSDEIWMDFALEFPAVINPIY